MKLRCKVCGGEGEVCNPSFEICKRLDDEAKELYGITEGDCFSCPFRDACQLGEWILCPNCEGNGYMFIDDEKWEIVEDEGGE